MAKIDRLRSALIRDLRRESKQEVRDSIDANLVAFKAEIKQYVEEEIADQLAALLLDDGTPDPTPPTP